MKPNDHYRLEDDINKVWGIKDMLDTFMWRYLDHPKPMTEDEVWNHIAGISTLLDMHCEKLMDTYCRVFELNEYASPEVKARRAEMLSQLVTQPKAKKAKKK